jgi:predicted nucleic acid-binding protein
MIVFDSYAWLEYFSGSEKGKTVREIIKSSEEILTPSICIAEIKRKYLKENKKYDSRVKFIITRSKIIKIDLNISLLAADISHENKLYMIDALVYACSLSAKSELLTGDQHFKRFKKIRFL